MDGPVEPGGGEPYDRGIEPRLSRTETDVRDVKDALAELKTTVARMDAQLDAVLPHLATKVDLAKMESRFDQMGSRFDQMDAKLDATLPHLATKADLAEKPSQTYMWGILAALLAAYACGMGALAVLLK